MPNSSLEIWNNAGIYIVGYYWKCTILWGVTRPAVCSQYWGKVISLGIYVTLMYSLTRILPLCLVLLVLPVQSAPGAESPAAKSERWKTSKFRILLTQLSIWLLHNMPDWKYWIVWVNWILVKFTQTTYSMSESSITSGFLNFHLTNTTTWLWRWLPHRLSKRQVVETSVTNHSPSQEYYTVYYSLIPK